MKRIIKENGNEPEDFCLAAEEHLKKKQKRIRYSRTVEYPVQGKERLDYV